MLQEMEAARYCCLVTKIVALLCALTCACSLLFEAETTPIADTEAQDASSDGPQDPLDADIPVEGMIGTCIIGMGAPAVLALTVNADSMPVRVCGQSATACGAGISPPCRCMPGSQCMIPFPIGSRVFMEVGSCSFWTSPIGNFAGDSFDVTITEPAPLVVVSSFSSCAQ